MLKFEIESLDEIDEAIKAQYAEQGGKFVLQVEGAESEEAVKALKTALVKERENAGKFEKFGSPDDIAAKIKDLETKLSQAGKKGGDKSEEHQAIIEQMKADHARDLGERDVLFTNLQGRTAAADLKAELAKVGVFPESLDLLANSQKSRIGFHKDGLPKIMTEDGGMPMVGSGRDGGATLEDLAKEVAKANPRLVEFEGKPGSGKPPGSNGKFKGQTMPRSDFDALEGSRKAEVMKEGVKLTD